MLAMLTLLLATPRVDGQPAALLDAEIQPLADARQGGDALRAALAMLAARVRQERAPDGTVPDELVDALRGHKRAYAALRDPLFLLTLRHASALVERPSPPTLDAILLRTSLALLAGTELVQTVHAVAAVLGEAPVLRDVWNEPDPAHGIPAGSWVRALDTARTVENHDRFRQALQRLRAHQADLERGRARRDARLRRLYPDGIAAGLERAERAFALLRAGLVEEDLGQDAEALRVLVEAARDRRAAWAAAAPALRAALVWGGPVRGDVQVALQRIKREYLDLREAGYRLARAHLPKLTREDIPYPPGFRIRAVSLSLLAGLTLYENARTIQTALLPIPGLRALFNQADPALGVPAGLWDRAEREFVRVEYRQYLEAGIRVLEGVQALPYDPAPEEDPLLAWIARTLAAGAALAEVRGERPATQATRALRRHLAQFMAMATHLPQQGTTQVSKGFGNLIGLVELRKGKLFDQPSWTQLVRDRLRPGDLLLEKTPFRLTDTFIPGHFGHVALYVGTEAELRDLGLLTHAWVGPHRAALASGRTIVESLRSGTRLGTVDQFLNIDDLAILRPKASAMAPEDVRRAITLAFTHVGKRYDFAFDTTTWDAIVCSELAFQTYVTVPWPVAKVLSGYTISPDDVAALAGSDPSRPFELVLFVHDGRVVHDPAAGVRDEAAYTQRVRSRAGLTSGPPSGTRE